ncbi:DUF4124 domain-containing protein [Photobacterium japonica]|uniref:DUF4124 domain-containing protein n=1 Tax=Photobacterium japonica TaxID=2910235 RepID=UPI003D12AD9D
MKIRHLTLLIGLGLVTGMSGMAVADTIYTWKDENGVTHFTDQPNPEAKVLDIKPPKRQSSPDPQSDTAANDPTAPASGDEDEANLPKAGITLLSPTHQQTLRDNSGNIQVAASSTRQLKKGHTARLLLDSKVEGRAQTQLQWQLNNINRGSHTLQVQLLKYGKVIASSDKVTVYLHRAGVNQRPTIPQPR